MRCIVALMLAGGLALSPAQAQNYALQESAVSGGGGTVSNGSGLTLTSSVGQAVTGTQQGGNIAVYSGYPAPILDARGLTVRFEQELSDAVPAGEPVTVVASVTSRSDIERVTLYYRLGGETSFEDVDMELSEEDVAPRTDVYQGDIPGSAITDRGAAYYVEADDGEEKARAPSIGVNSFPVRVADGIRKREAQPAGTSQSAYRLISVPINLDDKGASDVLADNLGDYDDTAWRFFEGVQEDGQTPRELSDESIDVEPGRAYWLIVADETDPIDTDAGTVYPIDEPFTVSLEEGWNYIGNPFYFSIPVSALERASGEEVALYAYDGSWSAVTDSDTPLHAFSGFAIESSGDDELRFDPTPANGSQAAQSKQLAAKAQGWSIRIAGRSGTARDEHNIAAVSANAKAGLDAMDWPEPPAPGAGVAVRFTRPEWQSRHMRYLVDTRAVPERGATWPFEVTAARRQSVTLTFSGLARVPESFEVWLLDAYSKASQDLRATPRYTIEDPPAEEARSFRLIVGKRSYVEKALEAAGALPTTYALADVYPNPTPGASTIRYGLPKEQEVTITVYNVLGQKVATLLQREPMTAGFHTVRWDGAGGAGAPVASGVYFVHMRAGDFTASKKIVRVN